MLFLNELGRNARCHRQPCRHDDAENRPTIGLRYFFGPPRRRAVDAGHQVARTPDCHAAGVGCGRLGETAAPPGVPRPARRVPGVVASAPLGGRAWPPPWLAPSRTSPRTGAAARGAAGRARSAGRHRARRVGTWKSGILKTWEAAARGVAGRPAATWRTAPSSRGFTLARSASARVRGVASTGTFANRSRGDA